MKLMECTICNNKVWTKNTRRKYCDECQVIADKERKAAWHKKTYVYKDKPKKPRVCEYCGSSKEVWFYQREIMLCKSHYHEMYNTGTIRLPEEKGYKNEIVYKSDCIEIHFKDGRIGYFDLEDKELVEKTYWGLDVLGYAHGKINGRLARFHRHLFDFPKETIDHINRDKLDNRKCNIRLCTQKENSRNLSIAKNNTSGVTGVSKTKHGKWRSRIMVNRKYIHLGNFKTLEEAKEARMKAEIKYFGKFSPNYQKYLN